MEGENIGTLDEWAKAKGYEKNQWGNYPNSVLKEYKSLQVPEKTVSDVKPEKKEPEKKDEKSFKEKAIEAGKKVADVGATMLFGPAYIGVKTGAKALAHPKETVGKVQSAIQNVKDVKNKAENWLAEHEITGTPQKSDVSNEPSGIKSPADYAYEYFGKDGESAASLAKRLKESGKSEDEAMAYMTQLYSGQKGGLSNTAIEAVKNEYGHKNAVAANTPKTQADQKDALIGGESTENDLQVNVNKNYAAIAKNKREETDKALDFIERGYKNKIIDRASDPNRSVWDYVKQHPWMIKTGALGSALLNSAAIVKGQAPNADSPLRTIFNKNVNAEMERYNKARDAEVDDMISVMGKEYAADQELRQDLKKLFANKSLLNAVQNLDIKNKRNFLVAYKKILDNGTLGTEPEDILKNVLKIAATDIVAGGKSGDTLVGAAQSLGNILGGALKIIP